MAGDPKVMAKPKCTLLDMGLPLPPELAKHHQNTTTTTKGDDNLPFSELRTYLGKMHPVGLMSLASWIRACFMVAEPLPWASPTQVTFSAQCQC